MAVRKHAPTEIAAGIKRVSTHSQDLDKIQFESLTDKSKLDGQPELFIHIIPNKATNTLTIVDSGFRMTKAGSTTKEGETGGGVVLAMEGQSREAIDAGVS
ncbi:hypothetical protein CTI12_AA164620 [Artemisia annua]|uniref:Uncharacterized protein n=1 Tax=Artemisia annua TaxID=35608 RepID=A0A2U1PDI4_ARTAN|nr:hypothetical protein CTI12_AA164620 [Artemisia annua]